ncbi:hypothetical protein [Desulfoscipio gibsoniae]|nr:hypothetical protein [Desulfoscipio gibsoniae]
MAIEREYGSVQPGINWGPFTARIPFIHVKVYWLDVLQGEHCHFYFLRQ